MASSKFNPEGSICVVTGGANGIGRSLCQHLASLGAKRVVVVDLSLSSAQTVVGELPSGVGLAICANCGVEMDIRRVITETEFQCSGPIDAFFCNAGIPANGGPEVPNDEWERIWQVNVMQSVYVSRHLFPKYVARGTGGVMVVTASSAGLLNLPGALAYSVTKHAAVGLAEGLSIAYASRGIQVSCLCPMGVRTGMVPTVNDGMVVSDAIVGADGILSPDDVAKETVSAVIAGKFMVLPHKKVKFYFTKKAEDYESWLVGMRKMYEEYGETMSRAPNMSSARL